MLHDQERHPVVRGQSVQQSLAGPQPARRGADRDDRKIRTVPRFERTANPTRGVPVLGTAEDLWTFDTSRESPTFIGELIVNR